MKKTFEYRAYPTFKQAKTLTMWLEVLRNLYNQALAWRKGAYQETGESISWVTQANALPDLRQESAQFASLHSDVLQDTLRRLDKAYQAFFRRVKAGDEPERSLSVGDFEPPIKETDTQYPQAEGTNRCAENWAYRYSLSPPTP